MRLTFHSGSIIPSSLLSLPLLVLLGLLAVAPAAQAANTTLAPLAAGSRFGEAVAVCGDLFLASDTGSKGVLVYSDISAGAAAIGRQEPSVVTAEVQAPSLVTPGMDCKNEEIIAIGSPSSNQTGLAYLWTSSPVTSTPDIALSPPGATGGDVWNFGAGVLVLDSPAGGDMDAVVAVGAPLWDPSWVGAVFVYHLPETNSAAQVLTASDAAVLNLLGSTITGSGSTIAASSPLGTGAVYIFEFQPATQNWTETQRIVPVDAASGDEFGSQLLFVSDDQLLVAATGRDSGRGAVYEYHRHGPGNWTLASTAAPSSLGSGASFGSSMARDSSGDNVLIGAPYQFAAAVPDAGVVLEWPSEDALDGNVVSANNEFGQTLAMADGGLVFVVSSNDGIYVFSPELCGDGQLEAGEECDDGDTTPGDGCSELCLVEFCGDGIVNNAGTESCDHGGTPSGSCSRDCISIEPNVPSASGGIFWGITIGLVVVSVAGAAFGFGQASKDDDDDVVVDDTCVDEGFDEIPAPPPLAAARANAAGAGRHGSVSMPNFETAA